MALGRAATHAVLLGDGRVLVVGNEGYQVSDDSTKAELWDPATGAWHETAGLNNPRADFATVSLVDGRALVTGGRNQSDQSFSSTYVYDPRPGQETWSKAGLLGTARTAPAAATLPDGRVLVAGGYYRIEPTYGRGAPDGVLAAYRPASSQETESAGPRLADIEPPNVGSALATAELFDPATDSWSATGPLNFARFGAAAVTLADGRVLVVGSGPGASGVSVDDRAYDSAEIYDPETGRFSLVGRLPDIDRPALEKLGGPGANPVPGDDSVIEDVGTIVALNDGDAVLVGHAGYWKHAGEITRSFRFEARAGGWTEVGQTYVYVGEPTEVPLVTLGVRRLAGAMVARLPDGRVLVAGGAGAIPKGSPYSNTYTTASTELYDPATDTWWPLPPMPEARAGGATVVLADGSVLLVGGYDDDSAGERIVLTSAIRFVPSP
jgi:Kelch motif.